MAVFALAAVLLSAIPSSAWVRKASAGGMVSRGHDASCQGRLPIALALLTEAIEADFRNPEAHFLRGMVLYRMNRLAEASEELEAARELESGRVEACITLARIYERQARYDQALANAMEAVKLDPGHRVLAAAYFGKGRYDKAIESYERALRTPEEMGWVHNNLGCIHLMNGDLGRAVRELEAAVRAAPDNAVARNNLGAALERSGRPWEARSEYLLATRIDPNYANPRRNLEELSPMLKAEK
jgi:tetratricopeptide (TPR) repeat protein